MWKLKSFWRVVDVVVWPLPVFLSAAAAAEFVESEEDIQDEPTGKKQKTTSS